MRKQITHLRSLRGRGPWKRPTLISVAAVALLLSAITLGGASREHELRLAVIELTGLLCLIAGLRAFVVPQTLVDHRLALSIICGIAALPLIQLLAVPPSLWTALPGREDLATLLDVAGQVPTWSPLSLTPGKTWRSFLALIPALTMFLFILVADHKQRTAWVLFLLVLILLSIMLGGAQLLSGGEGFYPWETTAAGNVTGFFANRNHLATLCLMGIPFACVLGAEAMRKRRNGHRYVRWLSAIYIALAVLAIAVIRSRAGFILAGPVLAASLLAAWVAAGRGRPKPWLIGVVGIAATGTSLLAAFAIGPLLERFDTAGAAEGRFENWPTVAAAADLYLPLGSGLGSFDAVFRSVEPLERLDPTYFNQAHNDYLETWLEAGWLGAGLLVAFLIWFGSRSWSAWRAKVGQQRDIQRAATIAVAVVLLHSAVDYPLRTVALMTVFALCCGILELARMSDTQLETRPRR